MRVGVAIVMGALVAGCSAGDKPIFFDKAGMTEHSFGKDRYECMQESQQRVSGAYVNAYGGSQQSTVVTNKSLMVACMEARGYKARVES